MKPRERQLAAIRHQLPDRIPVDAIQIENTQEVAAYLGILPEEVVANLGCDGRQVWAGAYLGPHADHDEGLSEWGSAASDDYGTSHSYPLVAATSVADIERYPWPDPAQYDLAEPGRLARDLCGEYAVRGPYWLPLFCQVCHLLGMEEALVKMRLEPVLFEAVLECVFQHTYERCRHFIDACGQGLDIFSLGDDFATQRGLLMRPADWRRFLKPRFARIFEMAHRAGKPVWFHSCGDVTSILPDLIDIGVDVWETVQLHALPISPETLKREYGRHLTFFGGINTQRLPFVSPGEVTREVVQCIEVLGKNGGYILGPDHHIKPDVSAENTVALFRTATSFRRGGYTLAAS